MKSSLFGIACVLFAALLIFSTESARSQKTNKNTNSTGTPRRPLPKPVAGSRGLEQYAGRDASSRAIAAAATRAVIDPATPHYDRGATAYSAANYKDAVEEFSEAVRLSPDWVQAHYALALSFTETDRLKEAIAEFRQVLKLNARGDLKIVANYNMGNAYADLGQYKEAIEAYQQAIKLDTESSRPQGLSKPHNNLGLAYAASDQLPEAIAEFLQAVRLRPDYAEAHFNLGVAYLQSEKKHEAEEQQQLLLKLNPELAAKLDELLKK
jgi:tetratricopeptide (TPR) repeat protein